MLVPLTYTQITSKGVSYLQSPWPFALWRLDLIGPLFLNKGSKCMIVAIDYYTKWVEEGPLTKISKDELIKFIWKNITYNL